MQIAVCIKNEGTAAQLAKLFLQYEQQRGVVLTRHSFNNQLAFLYDYIPGEYDAIFSDCTESRELIDELYKMDAGAQFVRLFSVDAIEEETGPWYCLPMPVRALFLFPVLDKIIDEASRLREVRMLIKKRGSVMYVGFSQIEYVEACSRVVLFHLTDKRVEEAIGNFTEYEEKLLLWPDFVKVHRSYIVNIGCVEKLLADSLLTKNGHVVPISKRVYPQFKRDFLGNVKETVFEGEKDEEIVLPPKPETLYNILLVDDERDELERWSGLLLQKGCLVKTASNADGAMELAVKHRFDCVLLDVNLGKDNGFELCESLSEKTGAPVVYLSTLSDAEHQIKGFCAGGADYLTKDSPPELIWAKVLKRIELAKAATAEIISGDLRLNPHMRMAYICEKALALTSVEFDLLCLLMQNSGTIFTPVSLYRLVWGTRQWDDGHMVQLHMTQLCNKLSQRYKKHNFIDSVWGEGYRFNAQTLGD